MKILLYGGTFDPPHYGHLNNLRAAASRVQPDEIVVMPAGVSPFKQMSATPGALRAEMCGCFAEAVQGPRAAARALHVSTWEMEQLDPGGSRVLFAPVTALPMASSDIRARLAGGESCENELPALVRRVIAREGLYRAKGD